MNPWEFILPAIPATILTLAMWLRDHREFRRMRDLYGVTKAEWEAAARGGD